MQKAWGQEALLLELCEDTLLCTPWGEPRNKVGLKWMLSVAALATASPMHYSMLLSSSIGLILSIKHLSINHTARDILSEDLISEHNNDGMLPFTAKERITYIYCL